MHNIKNWLSPGPEYARQGRELQAGSVTKEEGEHEEIINRRQCEALARARHQLLDLNALQPGCH